MTDIIGGSPSPAGPYRTTEEAVALISHFPTDFNFLPFIETASMLIDDIVASGCAAAYSPAKLELMERWLAAHFAAIQSPRLTSKSANGASVSFATTSLGEGLKGSAYGLQVLTLDTAGCLRGLGAAPMSVMFVGE